MARRQLPAHLRRREDSAREGGQPLIRPARACVALASLLLSAAAALGQEESKPISREEYETLRKQVQSLQQEVQTLRSESARKEQVDAIVAQIEQEAERFDEMLAHRSGMMKFLLSGNATFSYID